MLTARERSNNREPTGTGRRYSVVSVPVTAGISSSQNSAAIDSSRAQASKPPWARPGAPWCASVTVYSPVAETPSPATSDSRRPVADSEPHPKQNGFCVASDDPGEGASEARSGRGSPAGGGADMLRPRTPGR